MTHTLIRSGVLTASLALVAGSAWADPPAPPASAARMTNADEVRRALGLSPNYPTVPLIGDVKVAVLDAGFDRFDGRRPYLPKSAEIVEHYDEEFVRRNNLGDPAFRKGFLPGDPHGRLMAQMVWAATGGSPHGPKFYLLNANGPTLFRRAVRYAVEQKVDVILFSGTFEGAGNYDGRGPLAATVDEAVAAGIIWVNAAGNTGDLVYDGPVRVGPDGYLRLKAGNDPTALRFANRLDENAVTVTLTWTDYSDTEDAGTDLDLDLIVEDWQGRPIGESTLKQVRAGDAKPGETKNPRERLVLADLPANTDGREYRIRVKANSANFGPSDRLRILLSAAKTAPLTDPGTRRTIRPIEFLDATPAREIYPPADHAAVLTVGDRSAVSAVGPTADGRVKPDVILADSVARFSNGEESAGSSNAAAFLAGVIAVMKATEPGLTTAHVREWVRRLDARQLAADRVAAAQPVRPAAPPPVDTFVPLTPNQQRAMWYAEAALEEKRRRGETDSTVYVSTPRGSFMLTTNRPNRQQAAPPSIPDSPAQPAPVARAAPPDDRSAPHANWQTPSPRTLADLVRSLR